MGTISESQSCCAGNHNPDNFVDTQHQHCGSGSGGVSSWTVQVWPAGELRADASRRRLPGLHRLLLPTGNALSFFPFFVLRCFNLFIYFRSPPAITALLPSGSTASLLIPAAPLFTHCRGSVTTLVALACRVLCTAHLPLFGCRQGWQ